MQVLSSIQIDRLEWNLAKALMEIYVPSCKIWGYFNSFQFNYRRKLSVLVLPKWQQNIILYIYIFCQEIKLILQDSVNAALIVLIFPTQTHSFVKYFTRQFAVAVDVPCVVVWKIQLDIETSRHTESKIWISVYSSFKTHLYFSKTL